jgi:heterotetrameric sarcosine oxidase gamma subunit
MPREHAFVSDAAIHFSPGRFGRELAEPGLLVTELTDFELASVQPRAGKETTAAAAIAQAFGVRLPDAPQIVAGHDVSFIWAGPGHWLALSKPTARGIEPWLAGPLQQLASVCDQSDSRIMLEVRGPKVREVLAKGVSVDVHPRAFRLGDAAVTSVSHVSLQFWQTAEAPVYQLLVTRSSFQSFWRWLAASGAEYGVEVRHPHAYSSNGG